MSAAPRGSFILGLVAGLSFAAAAFFLALAVTAARAPASEEKAVLVGAGDIALCGSPGAERTAALLDRIEGIVVTLGDNAYPDGTVREFMECYEPTWGRHKARTRPAAGNHDYHADGAGPYFWYFGPAAGEPGKGYYSYDVGGWHVVVLNSNCGDAGGCGAGSAQERWLREDLGAHPARCLLAYWHAPLFTSGEHGPARDVRAFWSALHEAGAELVLSGHDHHYERFAPLDPQGNHDPERGIRQFVVGTGGGQLRRIEERAPHSETFDDETHGVLKLTLHRDRYAWEFVPVQGGRFSDAGSGSCH